MSIIDHSPDEISFESVTGVYPAGSSSEHDERAKLSAGIISETNVSPLDEYDLPNILIGISVYDFEGYRFRVFGLDDIHTLKNGLVETRDTRNNCGLCFSSVHHYTEVISCFESALQVRSFGEDSSHNFTGVKSVENCKECQSAIVSALDELLEEESEFIVQHKV